jgi:long-chain acyl-CoA synthetase
VRGYHEKGEESVELIEALVYPEQDWLKKLADTEKAAYKAAEARMEAIVEEVNQKLLPYQKILRVQVLRKPLEMTTTKKVKRFSL